MSACTCNVYECKRANGVCSLVYIFFVFFFYIFFCFVHSWYLFLISYVCFFFPFFFLFNFIILSYSSFFFFVICVSSFFFLLLIFWYYLANICYSPVLFSFSFFFFFFFFISFLFDSATICTLDRYFVVSRREWKYSRFDA